MNDMKSENIDLAEMKRRAKEKSASARPPSGDPLAYKRFAFVPQSADIKVIKWPKL